MQPRFFAGVLIGVLVLAALGCGTTNVGDQPIPQRVASQFSINVLGDTYVDGASVQGIDLSVKDYPQDVVVSVNARGAQGLKALYFEMAYDAQRYRPMTVDRGTTLGASQDVISLQYFNEPGKVYYGQVLTNYPWRMGFTGSGVLAQVLFKKAPAVNGRHVSQPPDQVGSTANLVWDSGTGTLSWYYYNVGDYDQKSMVSLTALQRLGANWNTSVAPAHFPEASALSVIDGNSDGLIYIQDLAPIGINWNKSAQGGYNVYHSADQADYPTSPMAPSDPAMLLDNLAFATATGTIADRKHFSYVVAAPVADDYYWVRPSDGTTDGTPSTLGGGPPPTLTLALTNPPASGAGTAADPYIADTATDYVFQVMHDPDGDVSTNTLTTYQVSDPAAGTISNTDATLNIDDLFTIGDFTVTAFYPDTDPSHQAVPVLYFHVGAPGGEVEIYPDPADADWTWSGGSGAGTEVDPYILDNTDYTRVYSMLADDLAGTGGTPIDVLTLTWDSFPPFATWTEGGSFQANMFLVGYVLAQQAGPPVVNSNNLWIEVHSLP
jgi:hypothetical protein